MPELNRTELSKYGWTTFQSDVGNPLDVIASSLGKVVPPRPGRSVTRVLRPREVTLSNSLSFSDHFGFGEFPLHTDCAYYRKPPDIVLFRAKSPSDVATLLLDGYALIASFQHKAKNAIFRVKGLRKHFFSPIVRNGKFRWDPLCMTPADTEARVIDEGFVDRCKEFTTTRYRYDDPSIVIAIDNRRILHGRENASTEPSRQLEAVLLYTT
jgi:hypothetical protein